MRTASGDIEAGDENFETDPAPEEEGTREETSDEEDKDISGELYVRRH